MTAAVSKPMLVDPAKGAKYPVIVAEDLLRNDQTPRRHFATIECTYIP